MIAPTKDMHHLTIEKVEKEMATHFDQGLTSAKVLQRQKQFGKNVLDTKPPRWWVNILLEQFVNPLVWVLVLAAGLAFFFQEELEGFAIVLVIFLNAAIGFFMELQANRSMESLKKLSTHMARAIRDGEVTNINSTEIVPGDILVMEAGDIVPADARIVVHQNLGVKEAALTGESAPISKTTDALHENTSIADRKNSLFKGTIITRGNAKAVVTQTGKNTELGKIATLAKDALQVATPIEKKLNELSKKLLWLTLVLTIIVLFVGYLEGRDIYLMAKTAIALGIAAIPEGLPVVATIGLAKGMLRLSKHNVIVKKLSAVETLGEVQVIFTDKTGTLTENRLSVQTLLFSFGKFKVKSGFAIQPLSTVHNIERYPIFKKLMQVSVLCNNASLGNGEKEENQTGDPLEIALLDFGKSKGFFQKKITEQFPRIKEIPFDSTTKMMGTLHQMPDGKYLVCIKGALEVILRESDWLMTDGEPEKFTDLDFWHHKNDQLAAQGERTLAFAYSIIDDPEENFFRNLTFIGCIGFLDPPRADVKAAIETCQQAGIQVVMVTGDHPETAKNIAQQVGLTQGKEAMVLHGDALKDVNTLNPNEIDNLLKTNVFARVSPAQKLDIISFYQNRNYIVGMTGDGVNDAPALKKSEIGIAMGNRGTEAAKESAELILEDDSFSSIVEAIRQGRGIFSNIRHFVVYLLSCNLGEVLVIILASLFPWGSPLFPLQILFLNMITDVFPALALGMGKTAKNAMHQPPRKSDEPFITRLHWRTIFIYSIAMTLPILGINYLAKTQFHLDDLVANNMVFYTLILVQLWHVFNLPAREASFFSNEVTKNKFIWGALILCLLIPMVLYHFESVRIVLNLRSLTLEEVLLMVGFSLIPVVLIQILKKLKVVL